MASVIQGSTQANPKIPVRPISLLTWIGGRIPLGIDKFFAAPGVGPVYDYPNPIRPRPPHQDWVRSSPIWFIGKDKQFAGAGQFQVYDYPNPKIPIPPIVNRTNSASGRIPIGLDQFFGAPGQGPTYDYPNPRVPIPPITNRTHADPSKVWLIGKDTFFSGAGRGPTYDYPNPRIAVPSLDLRTWTTNLLATTLGIVPAPFSQLDWPNPMRARPLLQDWRNTVNLMLLGQDQFFGPAGMAPAYDYPNPQRPGPRQDQWAQNLLTNLFNLFPFAQYDWPNPQRTRTPHQDWRDPLKLNLLNQDTFFGSAGQPVSYDYPNPQRPGVRQDQWVQDLLSTLLGVVVVPGPLGILFNQYDWQNPRLAVTSPILRTWIGGRIPLGVDQFFGAPGQPPTYDYPNPLRPGARQDQWIQDLLNTLLLPPVVPGPLGILFNQYDWPNPARPGLRQDQWIQSIIQSTLSLIVPPGPLGLLFNQYDYPLPQRGIPPAWLHRMLNASLMDQGILPFFNYDWPNPLRKGPVQDQWVQDLLSTLFVIPPMPYLLQAAQHDWPNPLRARPPLQDWQIALNLELLGQDAFFSGAGQPPTYDYPNPRLPIPSIALRTWIDSMIRLSGQDRFYGVPGEVPQYFYPNPAGKMVPVDQRTWIIANLLETTLGIPPGPALRLTRLLLKVGK